MSSIAENLPVKVLIGLAPKNVSTRMVLEALLHSPEQSRVSQFPILLTHPRTGITKFMSEYVDEILDDSRFAVETNTHLIFISRAWIDPITKTKAVFIPVAVQDKGTKKIHLLRKT